MKVLETLRQTGFYYLTPGQIVMFAIGLLLLYLAIKKKYEPYLLVPIGFGAIIVNLPLGNLIGDHGLLRLFYYGIEYEVLPPLTFLCIGAMTDFGPMIANPRTALLGAGAQFGIYVGFVVAYMLGFSLPEAAAIGSIGGADGPTTIFIASAKAPHILGIVTVAAYSYMALVPIIIPPIVKALTSQKERQIVMKQLRPVPKLEKIFFPILTSILVCLLVPTATPLIAMFMIGNLFRECGVVDRLGKVSQDDLMNIVTILLGLGVSVKLTAEEFLQWRVLMILGVGLIAFAFSVAGGVLLAKFMNLFSKEKINPMIGAAGLSAVPMSARVVQVMGLQANPRNYLLMHAMGPNVAGVIGTAVACGLFLMLV